MGRFRTALATISVGAMLATSTAATADGAPPITDEAHSSVAQGAGATGTSGTTGTGGVVPQKSKNDGKNKSDDGDSKKPKKEKKPKRDKKPQTSNPKTEDIIPPSSNPRSAEEAPDTDTTITLDPNIGLSGDSSPAPACDGSAGPPKNLIPIYIKASEKYDLGERGPQILAAINKVETDFGRLNQVTSYAGAQGWMQFMPATWDTYGTDGDADGKADPYNPRDAITSAARYLQAAGAPADWYDAVWAYNHADWYVQDVLDKAACYGALKDDTEKPDEDLKFYVCKPDMARTLEVPSYYMRAFESAASRYELGERGIWTLAAVARIESDYGRGMTMEQIRDTGIMGLSREEWKTFGVDGNDDGYVQRDEPWDAISTFARMLWSKPSLEDGLFAHNHASWYVEATMKEAARIAGDCDTVKTTWDINFPDPTTNATEINWDNLVVLNPAAQEDIQSGQIDSRVVNLLAMLTQKYSLTISALKSDHGTMTASGNVSNHSGGRAMDIASVNGVPCTDQSADSPCTEVGLWLASLPDGIKPTELIYGWDLDGAGPAFALSDHQNHIHAGFGL